MSESESEREVEQEQEDGIVPAVVDAHIKSLLTALGGFSPDDPNRYIPGDSAIDCLRDLKRWIRLFDERMNRLDVSRCISTMTLATVDLPHIICNWFRAPKQSILKEKLALQAMELLVLLTWSLDRDAETLTENHYMHLPALRLAQTKYKDYLIDPSFTILQAAVKIQLPAMATEAHKRSSRDEGILKMTLCLLRNAAQIIPPPDYPNIYHKTSEQRNALINAFAAQKVFPYLLTVGSNMGDDFRNEDTLLLEILFHLIKRTDAMAIFTPRNKRIKHIAAQTDAILAAEKRLAAQMTGRSRHSRFGTMVWMSRPDGKMTTLAGQDALVSAEMRQQKLDATKTYRPPRFGAKKLMPLKEMGPEPTLDAKTMDKLKEFATDFLDTAFNPAMTHIRRSLEREAPQVMSYHTRQFFYVVAWFLKGELERQKQEGQQREKDADDKEEVSGFNLIASALTQEMFVLLQRSMRLAYENKMWIDLVSGMRCLNQILLVVKELHDSPLDTDIEIADNILRRLFYEEDTQDLLATVLRQYSGQGIEYLDAAIELVHNYTHLLSAYSSQNKDMQVRTKRAIRRNRKKAAAATPKLKNTVTIVDDDGNEIPAEEDDAAEVTARALSGSEEEDDEAAALKVTSERKFDFNKFLVRFSAQPVVDTYVTYLKHYRDLDNEQLKRVHRYFYRLGFKQELAVMMYKVDVINLFYEMIKGPNHISSSLSIYKDWSELAMRVIRKCIAKLQKRPALFIEMLFSKSSQTAQYLEYGEAKKKAAAVKPARVAAELVFRHTEELEEQIRFLVRVLYSQGKHAEVKWLAESLDEAISVRKAWLATQDAERAIAADAAEDGILPKLMEPEHVIRRVPDEETQNSIIKNGHLRLFMKAVGLVRELPLIEETIESKWMVPSSTTTDHLEKCAGFLAITRMEEPSVEDTEAALAAIRKKPAQQSARMIESDSEDDDFEALFPIGGPTTRKVIDAPKRKAKKRLRHKASNDELPSDSEIAERARRRKEKEREKAMKVKSEMFVHSSDDDSDVAANDAEFWMREEEQRRRNEEAALKASVVTISQGGSATLEDKAREKLKRKKAVESEGEEEEEEEDDDDDEMGALPDLDEGEDVEIDGGVAEASKKVVEKMDGDNGDGGADDVDADTDEDDEEVTAPVRRKRTTGGFVIDSDDEEE